MTLLIMFLPYLLFAQEDKTTLREKEILKQQHVRSRTTNRVGNLIPFQYEEFDRDGNLVLDVYFDGKQDTIKKYTYVYNSSGQLIITYQYCKNSCLVSCWKNYYSGGYLTIDSAFDKNNHVVVTNKHIPNKEGRDSLICSSKYDVQFRATTVWDSGAHEYTDIYGFSYDTTNIWCSGDTAFYHSPKTGSYIVVTSHNPQGYKLKIAEFYNLVQPYGTQKFEYDNEGNCITTDQSGAHGEWHAEYRYVYNKQNLKIKVINSSKWSTVSYEDEYKYTYY